MAYAMRTSKVQGVFYVYLLQSESAPGQRYIGFTADVGARLKAHNKGSSPHTSKFRPWRLVAYFAFQDEATARAFEFYLKSGSGKAFAAKRLWPKTSQDERC